MSPQKLSFPKDVLPHDSVIEWWYINGNVRDGEGREYAFMQCLFRVDPKRVNLPFLEKVPLPALYFSHHLVSDIGKKKTVSGVHFFYELPRATQSNDGLLHLALGEMFSLEEQKPFSYQLRTGDVGLALHSRKPPMLVNESGWVPVKGIGAYYYSLPGLAAKGTLRLGGKDIAVTGKAWMDHQWSDAPASAEDKWTWFSLQFDDGIDLLACAYGDKRKFLFATISKPDGTQATTHNITFRPTGEVWTSTETGASYPVSWEILIPEWNMTLETAPKLAAQEVLFGPVNYWEGPIVVNGKLLMANGETVNLRGEGFMELVGIPMKTSAAKLYLQKTADAVSHYVCKHIACG